MSGREESWGYRYSGVTYRLGARERAEQRLADRLCMPLSELRSRIGEQVDGDQNEIARFVVMGAAARYHRAYLVQLDPALALVKP